MLVGVDMADAKARKGVRVCMGGRVLRGREREGKTDIRQAGH